MNGQSDQEHSNQDRHWWGGWQRPHPWPLQLALSVGLAAVATLLTMWVWPYAPQFTYGFYYAAVLLVTLYSGLGAGILTTVLSVLLGDYFFVRPPGHVLSTPEEILHALTFVLISGLICTLAYLRTRSEAKLRDRERFIENLAATAPYTLYLYDVPNERIAYVTSGDETDGDKAPERRADGRAPRAVLRPQVAVLPSVMLPEDQVRYSQHVSDLAAMPSGSVLTFQHRIQAPDGEWRWYERQEQVYDRLDGGAVHHLLGVAQDITERKAVEDRVRYQAQLLDSVDQAIITVDLSSRVTYWNRFAEALYVSLPTCYTACLLSGDRVDSMVAAPPRGGAR